jgi:hypothetical protein
MSEPVTAPPPPAPASPPPVYPVEALYTPKSLTVTRQPDGSFNVRVKSPNIGALMGAVFAAAIIFLVVPLVALMGGGELSLLVLLAAIGLWIFLWVKGVPPITISANGIQIGSRFYRMEDVAGFVDSADDGWSAFVVAKTGLRVLGLRYGIYAVRTPYVLTEVEALKVAPHLTRVVQSVARGLATERDLKVQQAQVF